jgi:dTMP kinase
MASNADTTSHALPEEGRLFVLEGIDGAGKSTQLSLLAQWLRNRGHSVLVTGWDGSSIMDAAVERGERRKLLSPLTHSLLHATRFADCVERQILPALKAGAIVLADRYIYSAYARDASRGVKPAYIRSLYRNAAAPTLAFYLKLPLDVALRRALLKRPKLDWYRSGMDLGLRTDARESYRLFQSTMLEEFERLAEEFDLEVLDAVQPVEVQQRQMREAIQHHLPRNERRLTYELL